MFHTSRPQTRRSMTATVVRVTAAAAMVAVVTAGCSTKSDSGTTEGGSGKLATGQGVTDKSIKLGVLTDQTGVFAGAGKAIGQGRQLFWDAKNGQGGVCNRQVEFVVKDHGYNPQQAVAGYAQVKNEVLAIDELLGSPMIAALLPSLESDQMLTLAASFSSSLLANPYVVVSGTTYDVEMINGLQALVDSKKLAAGDTVSHIYLDGDYGLNALAGAKAAASQLGLKLVEHKIKPTDADLTAQVTASKNAGAKAVLLTTTGAQTGSAVSVAQGNGYDATFLGSNPAFSPTLLKGSAKSALETKLYVVSSIAPFSSDAAGPTQVRQSFTTKFPDQPQSTYVMYGYAQGEIMARILEAACQNNELTRPGLLNALKGLSNIDTQGLIAPLDYSKPGGIPGRQVYLMQPSATTPGGLKVVQSLFSSPIGDSYQPAK
jgi:ABC-type branched-subunit amino acid transport system substrate-binding protein